MKKLDVTTYQRERVNGGVVCLNEEFHQLVVSVLCRQVEWREALLGLGVDEGFVPQQNIGNLIMAVLPGKMERCLAVLRTGWK